MELRALAHRALIETDPHAKVALINTYSDQIFDVDPFRKIDSPMVPGRPSRPALVHPARVPRRRVGTPLGRAALVHALAHIEFNAVNLALDAIVRFASQPAAYYRDWWLVACEEAHHFELLAVHLASLGYAYGDFPAHDGLWEAAYKTRDDVLARMALVPRILEARGLDVTPAIQARLRTAGDLEAVNILDILLRDEIGHVAIGNRWYVALCADRNLDPVAAFLDLCAEYGAKLPQPPFNVAARSAAGFDVTELSALAILARS